MYLGTFAFIGCMVTAILISILTGGDEYKPGTVSKGFNIWLLLFNFFVKYCKYFFAYFFQF